MSFSDSFSDLSWYVDAAFFLPHQETRSSHELDPAIVNIDPSAASPACEQPLVHSNLDSLGVGRPFPDRETAVDFVRDWGKRLGFAISVRNSSADRQGCCKAVYLKCDRGANIGIA